MRRARNVASATSAIRALGRPWTSAKSMAFTGLYRQPGWRQEAPSGRHHNQRMSQWEYGKDIDYLTHKIELAGMSSFIGSERGTSSRCPACGHRHKPKGREWACKACGFRGHRDLVGSINMHPIAFGEKPIFPAAFAITYLRPGTAARKVFDRSNRPDPGLGEGMKSDCTHVAARKNGVNRRDRPGAARCWPQPFHFVRSPFALADGRITPNVLAASIVRSEGNGCAFCQMPRISRRKMLTVTSPIPLPSCLMRLSRSASSAASRCNAFKSPA